MKKFWASSLLIFIFFHTVPTDVALANEVPAGELGESVNVTPSDGESVEASSDEAVESVEPAADETALTDAENVKPDTAQAKQADGVGTTEESLVQPAAEAMAASSSPSVLPYVQSDNPLTFLKGLNGTFEADLFTGAATYHLPLWIPDGRTGMQPTIGLNYSSNNRRLDSYVGYGWALSNSGIYRSTPQGINKLYEKNDFSMELFGSTGDLINVNSATGKYASKVESDFSDFVFQNNTWTMTDTKGTKYYFGLSDATRQNDPGNSSHVYKWLLQKIQDRNGNYITFTYFKDNGQIYPDTIRYTGNGADQGLYEIKFIRTPNTYPITSFITGFKVKTGYLIDRIDVQAYTGGQPQLVRSYDLNYTYGNNALPKLTEVVTKSGPLQLPPLQFFYFDGTQSPRGPMGVLRKIQYPAGAVQEMSYKKSTAYRTPAQGVANRYLPFDVDTVYQMKQRSSQNDPEALYTYDYSDGHYYFDSLDAYKKEYAGFHKVKITDPASNTRTLYFHQSEFSKDTAQSAPEGEFQDHISKKGHIYREEVRDSGGNLFDVVIRKWDKRSETDDDPKKERWFPFLARETLLTYDGDATKRSKATEYTYDQYGNITQTVDYGEVTLTDNSGNFIDILQDKIIHTTEFIYNTPNYLLAFPKLEQLRDNTSTLIGETKSYYDTLAYGQIDKGNLTKEEKLITAPSTYQTSQFQYNTYGLVTKITNPRLYETNIVYEPTYNLFPQTVTNAKNQATQYSYNVLYGVPSDITDPNGAKITNIYEGLGRITEIKKTNPASPAQQLTAGTFAYNTASYPSSITSTLLTQNQGIDRISVSYVDGFERPLQTKVEAEGLNKYTVTSNAYDLRGNLQKTYLPKFTTGSSYEALNANDPATSFTYDVLNRQLTAVTSVGTTATQYSDWKTTVTDSDGKKKDYLNDAQGNLVEVKEYLGVTPYSTVYTYNPLNQLTKITDAKGNIRNMTYDLLGRKLTQQDLHTSNDTTFGTWSYGYDSNSNLTSSTDPKNQNVLYTYDQLDRPLTENYQGQAGTEVTYTYDAGTYGIGHLTSVTTPSIQKSFSYDILGRNTQEQKIINAQTYTTAFGYDLAGNVLSVTYPDNISVTYAYNNAATLNAVNKGGSPIVSNIDYAPTNAVSTLAFANGVTTVNTYDPQKLYRLTDRDTTKGANKLQDIAYQYSPVGNVTQIVDASNHNGAKTAVYSYDDLHRLSSATITNAANSQNYTHNYTYSIIGNILTRTDASGTYVYAGGNSGTSIGTIANPHAVTSVGSTNYSYDANGNLTSNGTWTHSWDYKDRLTSSTSGPVTLNYSYDESGNRIKKVNQSTGKTTVYVNQYYDVEGAATKKYLYAGGLKVATDSAPDGLVYHHTDHLTGANVDTNSQGTQIEALDYYPYGNIRLDEQAGAYENDYKYTGKELDDETNLYYYGARYYDANIGRFVSVDPWGGDLTNPQSLNKYSYVMNNPLKYVDPTGAAATQIQALLTTLYRYGAPKVGGSYNVDIYINDPANGTKVTVTPIIDPIPPQAPYGPFVYPVPATPSKDDHRTNDQGSNPDNSPFVFPEFQSPFTNTFIPDINAFDPGSWIMTSQDLVPKGGIEIPTEKGVIKIPEGYGIGPAENGKGKVYRPQGSTGNKNSIRSMDPDKRNPNGYVRIYNNEGQPINPDTGKPDTDENTHIGKL